MIKKLLITLLFISQTMFQAAYGEQSKIVALVNNVAITSHEFEDRKKLLMLMHNISSVNSTTDKRLSKAAINGLIDEEVNKQHFIDKKTVTISKEQIDSVILDIEKRNNMPKGNLLNYLKANGVSEASFRSQIQNELIKMNVISSIAGGVTVSSKEVDYIVLFNNSKDAEISAKLFTSKDLSKDSFKKMSNLKDKLKTCESIKPAMLGDYVNFEDIKKNLSDLPPYLQSLAKDISENQSSNVFQNDGKFHFLLVCEKKIINISADESNNVVNFLNNRKMSQKAHKFFQNLRKKAYVKILIKI